VWNRFLGHFRPLLGVHPIGPIWKKPFGPFQHQKDDLGKRPCGALVVSKSDSEGPFGSIVFIPNGRTHFYKVLIWFFFRSWEATFCWRRKVLKTGDFTPRKPELITIIGNGYENSKNAKSPHLVHNKWKNWDIIDSGTLDPFLGSDPDFNFPIRWKKAQNRPKRPKKVSFHSEKTRIDHHHREWVWKFQKCQKFAFGP